MTLTVNPRNHIRHNEPNVVGDLCVLLSDAKRHNIDDVGRLRSYWESDAVIKRGTLGVCLEFREFVSTLLGSDDVQYVYVKLFTAHGHVTWLDVSTVGFL